ncbi:class I SAM-dependent methyltransferase [Streptomyces sp. RKAG293]|uniref:class I SAM-dependent methyltransferase n=1 Tax=Streptomyces sp. RKAG293 TaxID=2893403 RepID=UPI00203454E3|nr:class I SAM-dependent methyltransferase [Streptomyces sp. RKAG293]MCM2416564.1 class I SAM-dependent methyltransferase [Streptomyces sp. RKAG293]
MTSISPARGPRAESECTSADAIEFHYDVGNDFYALWLDETLAYSAAVWDGIGAGERGVEALAAAQRAKFALHLDLAGAPASSEPGDFSLLDVGCGWGGLIDYAVRTGRVTQATGLTLSRAQRDHIHSRGLPEVRVALEGWDAHQPERPYDGIISVGAFEHFVTGSTPNDQRITAYRSYFEKCYQWLSPGAGMSLQTIAYDGVSGPKGPVGSFVASEIFPDAALPRLSEITAACDPYFSVTWLRSSARDYARTLGVWSASLLEAREEAQRVAGDEVYRRYRRYLRACEVTFVREAATLYRIGFRRRDEVLQLSD